MIALLNTTIITTDGSYTVRTVPLRVARLWVTDRPVTSYVGHESTARLMSRLLGIDVPVSRDQLVQEVGQVALALKLDNRPPPGRELTMEELEEIGYSFKLITRIR